MEQAIADFVRQRCNSAEAVCGLEARQETDLRQLPVCRRRMRDGGPVAVLLEHKKDCEEGGGLDADE
jgi:hypothetical protein